MGQARRVGSRKHPTGPMPQYQQEERRFCTCYSANPRQSPKPESSFCPWPTVAASVTVGTGQAGAAGPIAVVVHHWCQSSMSALFFSSRALIGKKTSKWSLRCDQWQPGPSWNLTAGGGERIPWRHFYLSHLLFGWRRFPSVSSLFI